jgi:hypothetical protein
MSKYTKYLMPFSGAIAQIDDILGGDLHEMSQEFDKMVADNNQWLDQRAKNQIDSTNNKFMKYNLIVSTKISNTFLKVLQGQGAGLVDVFQMGEFARNPSFGSLFRDTLRTTAVVDAGAGLAGLGKRFTVYTNRLIVSGGPMSCFFTSQAQAVNMSGQRIFMNIDDVARAEGFTGPMVSSPHFPGHDFFSVSDTLTKLKIRHSQSTINFKLGGKGLDDVVQRVLNTGDPHLIGITTADLAGGHMMNAYRFKGQVHLSDQFGTWVLTKAPAGFKFTNIHPTSLAKLHNMLEFTESNMASLKYLVTRIHGVNVVPRRYLTAFDIAGHNLSLFGADSLWTEFQPITINIPKLYTFRLPNLSQDTGYATSRTKMESYTVQRGDTLFGLAKRHYRDAAQYTRIVAENPKLAGYAGHLQLPIGQTVVIPITDIP